MFWTVKGFGNHPHFKDMEIVWAGEEASLSQTTEKREKSKYFIIFFCSVLYVIQIFHHKLFTATMRLHYFYFQMPAFIGGVLCAFWLGLLLGPCVVLLITGFICDSLGWPMVFYIFGESLSIKIPAIIQNF